ncbi:hypothetical protein DFH06DRAFT_1275604 [Mycena polygramma]|nr:hypothetical protein DFH06DRAFT_1275604 [Mycena polygramma]
MVTTAGGLTKAEAGGKGADTSTALSLAGQISLARENATLAGREVDVANSRGQKKKAASSFETYFCSRTSTIQYATATATSSSNLTPRPPGTPTAATVASHAHHINTPSPLPPPQPRLPSGPPMSSSQSRGGGYGGNGGNGGNGGGDSNGGGGGGGGGGGAPGGGNGPDQTATPGYPPAGAGQWQLNPKLNISVLTAFDGRPESIISYVESMAYLANLGPLMSSGIAQLAPLKFTGRAQTWWGLMPEKDRAAHGQDWPHLLLAMRDQFLTATWVQERSLEFEDMRFRQRGHETEEPTDFFARRKKYHSFLYSEEDGPMAVARIIRTQPPEWAKEISEVTCPTLRDLQLAAEHDRGILMTAWENARTLKALANAAHASTGASSGAGPSNGRVRFRLRRKVSANATDKEAVDELFEAVETDSEGEGPEKTVNAADGRRKGSGGQPDSKPPWPKGQVVGGYNFKRDDSVVSEIPPKGDCFICTSPKHMALQCPHRGAWQALRHANVINVDYDAEDEAMEENEFLANLVESNARKGTSAYSSESFESSAPAGRTVKKEVFTMNAQSTGALAAHLDYYGYNRNRRRHDAFAKPVKPPSAKEKGKGKEGEESESDATSEPVPIPRKYRRKSARLVELDTHVTDDGKTVHEACRVRQLPDGLGSLGACALHIKVRIGSLEFEAIRGRLDSGADITLISEDFWKSIPGLPKPREGIRMKLYHLTGQAKVLGYIKVPMYVETKDGEIVSFELEAYVVRNMRVPLLLGEDFQTAYELGRGTSWEVKAHHLSFIGTLRRSRV